MAPINDEISLHKFLGQIAHDLYQAQGNTDQSTITNGYPEGIRPDTLAIIHVTDQVLAVKGQGAKWGPYPTAPTQVGRWGEFVWS